MTNAKRFCSASISEKITFTLKWDSWTIYYSIYIYETRLHCINVMYVNIILNRTKFRVNVIMLLILSIMIARIYVVHILSYNCTEFKKVPLNLELPRLPLRAMVSFMEPMLLRLESILNIWSGCFGRIRIRFSKYNRTGSGFQNLVGSGPVWIPLKLNFCCNI